jgi:hypothetical protein
VLVSSVKFFLDGYEACGKDERAFQQVCAKPNG